MDSGQNHDPTDPPEPRVIRLRALRAPIVGRDAELNMVAAEWSEAIRGGARAVTFSGDAGIGKSRLLRSACDQSSTGGPLVLVGRCVDEQGMPPYMPWIDALSRPPHAHAKLDAMRERLLGSDVPGARHAEHASPSQRKLRLFAAVADLLAVIASACPVLLAFDDLHWSDGPSNELLRYVMSHNRSSRLLVIGTARPDEAAENMALQRTLDVLHRQRQLTIVPISPLGPTDVARHIEALTGVDNLPLARAIHGHCEGNPFFIEELIQQISYDGALLRGADASFLNTLPIPRSVAAIIVQRLERLDRTARIVLDVAALYGNMISIELLTSVGMFSVESITEALDAAVALGLVRRSDSDAREVGIFEDLSLAHDRVRETIEREMNPIWRRRLHGRIAAALARTLTPRQDLRHLAMVTHHYHRAGMLREAAAFAERLGDAAMPVSAYTTAAKAYATAHGSAPDEAAAASLSLKLGDAHLASGDHTKAIAAYTRAEQAYASFGMPLEHARALRSIGSVHGRDERFDQAVAYLRAAIDTLERFQSGVKSDITADSRLELAATLVEIGALQGTSLARYDDAIANGRRGLDLAARAGAADALVPYARLSLAKSLMRSGELAEGYAVLEPALPLALKAADMTLAAELAGALANHAYWQGDLETSERAARQRHDFAQRSGDPFTLRHAGTWLANLALARGQWNDALRLLADAETQLTRVESPEPHAFSQVIGGLLEMGTGDPGRAVAHLEEAMARFRLIGPSTLVWYLGLLATAHLERGDVARAREVAAETDDLVNQLPKVSLPRAPALCQLGIVSMRSGNIDAAAVLYPSLLPFAGQHHWVLVDRVLGMLAASRGDRGAAARHFATAIATANQGGIAPERALTLAEQGRMLMDTSDAVQRDAAAEMLQRAVDQLRMLGMDRAAGRYTFPEVARAARPAGLTPREVEVLALVAAGKTNREIAHNLGISEKTVTNHLTHVFTKANLENRSAAVAFAIRHGLAT